LRCLTQLHQELYPDIGRYAGGLSAKGIRALKEEGNIQNFAVVSCDRYERKTEDKITIFPWKLFLKKLWNGEII
jgi:hypothetical protein